MRNGVYACVLQRDFALKHLPDDPMFKLVSKLYETVPGVLQATGKVHFPCVQSLPWSHVLTQPPGSFALCYRQSGFHDAAMQVIR